MPQYAILRFAKHKGAPSGALEAHHERKKERYASNPDIDTERSKYNFHTIKPKERYSRFIKHRIEESGCRTRKDSTRFVDTLITASPEFFKGKSTQETAAYFKRATEFLADRVGRENIISAVVHMDEKTPHLHLTFVPLTNAPCTTSAMMCFTDMCFPDCNTGRSRCTGTMKNCYSSC